MKGCYFDFKNFLALWTQHPHFPARPKMYGHRGGIPGLRASALVVVVVVVVVVLLPPGGIPLAVLVLYELIGAGGRG